MEHTLCSSPPCLVNYAALLPDDVLRDGDSLFLPLATVRELFGAGDDDLLDGKQEGQQLATCKDGEDHHQQG